MITMILLPRKPTAPNCRGLEVMTLVVDGCYCYYTIVIGRYGYSLGIYYGKFDS